MGGYFNLITSLWKRKGKKEYGRILGILQGFIEESYLVDLEIGNGWFTWNNQHGGHYHVASILDRFLVSEDISREAREFSAIVLSTNGSDH